MTADETLLSSGFRCDMLPIQPDMEEAVSDCVNGREATSVIHAVCKILSYRRRVCDQSGRVCLALISERAGES